MQHHAACVYRTQDNEEHSALRGRDTASQWRERTFGLLYTITARDSSLHFSFLAERGNGSVDPTDYVRLLNMRHSSLWSADENTLLVPRTSLKFGEPAFSVAGPAAWNSLPADIRTKGSNTAFKKRLKTFLFINVYDVTDY